MPTNSECRDKAGWDSTSQAESKATTTSASASGGIKMKWWLFVFYAKLPWFDLAETQLMSSPRGTVRRTFRRIRHVYLPYIQRVFSAYSLDFHQWLRPVIVTNRQNGTKELRQWHCHLQLVAFSLSLSRPPLKALSAQSGSQPVRLMSSTRPHQQLPY